MSKPTRAQIEARDEARDTLRAILPPGSTVSTKVLHVSRSGMSRTIGLYAIDTDHTGRPYIRDISALAATAAGFTFDRDRWGIKTGGTGMDMTFHAVYGLSRALYPDGYRCTGSDGYTPRGRRAKAPRCPSNDHSNDYGRLAREYDAAHVEDESAVARAAEAGDDAEARRIRSEYVSARQEWIGAQESRLWLKRRHHSDGGYAISRASL